MKFRYIIDHVQNNIFESEKWKIFPFLALSKWNICFKINKSCQKIKINIIIYAEILHISTWNLKNI